LQYFLQNILVQTALQGSAALVRKVNFYFYFSSLNKHTNKNRGLAGVKTSDWKIGQRSPNPMVSCLAQRLRARNS
jgi:hypothetical protein